MEWPNCFCVSLRESLTNWHKQKDARIGNRVSRMNYIQLICILQTILDSFKWKQIVNKRQTIICSISSNKVDWFCLGKQKKMLKNWGFSRWQTNEQIKIDHFCLNKPEERKICFVHQEKMRKKCVLNKEICSLVKKNKKMTFLSCFQWCLMLMLEFWIFSSPFFPSFFLQHNSCKQEDKKPYSCLNFLLGQKQQIEILKSQVWLGASIESEEVEKEEKEQNLRNENGSFTALSLWAS